jgi:hypothetical protein
MHDPVQHQALGVDQDVPLLAFDLLAGIVAMRIGFSLVFGVFCEPDRYVMTWTICLCSGPTLIRPYHRPL